MSTRHPHKAFNPIQGFDKNECLDFITQQKIIKRLDFSRLHRYVDARDIIDKISHLVIAEPQRIYVDNGSEQVLKALIQCLDVKGYDILSPAFEMFPYYCGHFKRRVSVIPVTQTDGVFSYKIRKRESAFYAASPHNPTGLTFTIDQVLRLCDQYKYVIIDEAYVNPLSVIRYQRPNLIIVRTFSKMGGFAGIRFGFCIASAKIIDQLNATRPMFINSLAISVVDEICKTPTLLRDLEHNLRTTANRIIEDFGLDNTTTVVGNFLTTMADVDFFGKPVKRYVFDNTVFTRITLCDINTYTSLINESIHELR